MIVALDATYSLDTHPSGVAVYSREIMDALVAAFPGDRFLRYFRWKQWRRRPFASRLLLPPLPTFGANVFHGLNQRVDRRSAPRVVSTFHDLFVMTAEYSSAEFRRRFSWQARQAAANSDLIIAVSHYTATQVEQLLRVPASRIRVIPHGVRRVTVEPGAVREPIVLFVGALQKRKNVVAVVKAFEALPSSWRLVLAGATSGFGADEIIQAAAQSSCAARIRIAGYIGDIELSRLYATSSIFAFPSLDEGFGMPVLEAMAHGLPVITSNGSGLREVAEGAALLVDPAKTGEIADALVLLAENDGMREELVRLGHLRSDRFTWDGAARRTYEVYRELS